LPGPLAKAVADLDSNLPTYFGGTPARLHDELLGWNRIIASLFTIFGVAAFVLAAVGLYGVMSFSVSQRTQEFGIRMALGADAPCILRQVMKQGAWQVLVGLALGIGGAAILLLLIGPTALQDFLFKVNALDPFIYGAVAATLSAVAAISCLVPARRATRVNPMIALRSE
jgi:ABC-type antimicrobial peptide transport system permease subunit